MRLRRSLVNAPGGFAHATALNAGISGSSCALCSRTVIGGGAWLHVSRAAVVCDQCLPDPWHDEGEAGLRAARQLDEQAQRERELWIG